LPRKIIFDIHLNPSWQKWQIKCSKLAANDCETSKFHQETWNRYHILRFVPAHSTCHVKSNLELRRSNKTLRDDLFLPSTTTLSNINRSEYALTVDAIKKQMPWRNEVTLALDSWTSTNKLATMFVITYYMDPNWALHEVQLAFDKVDRLVCSCFKR
jgi:hypothetical protein